MYFDIKLPALTYFSLLKLHIAKYSKAMSLITRAATVTAIILLARAKRQREKVASKLCLGKHGDILTVYRFKGAHGTYCEEIAAVVNKVCKRTRRLC